MCLIFKINTQALHFEYITDPQNEAVGVVNCIKDTVRSIGVYLSVHLSNPPSALAVMCDCVCLINSQQHRYTHSRL